MNGPLTTVLYVLVFERKGRSDSHIIVRSAHTTPKQTLRLEARYEPYAFYLAEIEGDSWALLSSDPSFGLPLSLLRGLEKAGSIEVACNDGRAYFT